MAVFDAKDVTTGPVRTHGLRQLDRFFGQVSKGAQRELRAELRVLARSVRDEARVQAERQGFGGGGRSGRGRGDLLRKLTFGVRAGLAWIAEGAVRTTGRGAPFKYPAVFEFGRRQHRPFLLPALAAKRNEVERGMERHARPPDRGRARTRRFAVKLRINEKEYEAPDIEGLSFREQGIVNRVTELAGPLEWQRAWEAGNPLMFLALLMIAMRRAGVRYDEDQLLDSPALTTIEVIAEEEDEQLPPADAGDGEEPEPVHAVAGTPPS
jgi:hypothetical protein